MITGHSEEDDYTDGTTDVPVEGGYGPNYGSATMTLEQMIKQYTGPEGGYLSRNGSPYMAVVDGPFITARTTPDSYRQPCWPWRSYTAPVSCPPSM